MSDHQTWDEMAAGYALHALTAREELQFTSHLAGCDRCQASVDDHSLVAAQLGSLATPAESAEAPSWDEIRGAVMAEDAAFTPLIADELQARRRRRYEVSRRSLAAAAGVAVLVGGGITTWRVLGSDSPPRQVAACAHTAGCHVIHLTASKGGADEGTVTVQGSQVTVEPTSFEPAAAGKTYVLWQQPRDGKATAVSQFDRKPVTGSLGVDYTDVIAFMVSQEPAGSLVSSPSKVLAVGVTS